MFDDYVDKFARGMMSCLDEFSDFGCFVEQFVKDELYQEILDSDEANSLISCTNACGWSIETVEVGSVGYYYFGSVLAAHIPSRFTDGKFVKVTSSQGLDAVLLPDRVVRGVCIDIAWSASGDHDPDHMYCGDEISGKLLLIYKENGSLEYKICDARLEGYGDEDSCLEDYEDSCLEDYEDPSDRMDVPDDGPDSDDPTCDQCINERK